MRTAPVRRPRSARATLATALLVAPATVAVAQPVTPAGPSSVSEIDALNLGSDRAVSGLQFVDDGPSTEIPQSGYGCTQTPDSAPPLGTPPVVSPPPVTPPLAVDPVGGFWEWLISLLRTWFPWL